MTLLKIHKCDDMLDNIQGDINNQRISFAMWSDKNRLVLSATIYALLA